MKYLFIVLFTLPSLIFAQYRPQTFFREDFKETPAEIPVTQDHIANPDLKISLYGSGAGVIKKSNHDKPADDPFYIWSGLCEGNWAVTLKHVSKNVDLSKNGKIRWRSKQSGFRQLRLILKLSDGSWLVSDLSDGASLDWRIYEFNISDIRWMSLDIDKVLEKKWVENPDLSKVEEIGWTDLMIGGGSIACSRVDWIEVDGFPINRD
ncbi:hypothetical protein [Reichenbachiella sp. MALMAid0571]|uniref:hypothetical protein n=1 Tax=Reichenbachiella sp. MALMAid0571 TaxID=3143939 RepID=UPI0032DED04A